MTTARRPRGRALLASVALAVPLLTLLPATAAHAAPRGQTRDSGPAVAHDTSPPLRDIEPSTEEGDEPKKEHFDKREDGMPQQPAGGLPADLTPNASAAAAPATSTNFDGIGNGVAGYVVDVAPPDTSSAVGLAHVVEVVNSAFAVYSKTGTLVYGPANTNTLWSGFGGSCQSTNDGDGIVRYDRLADRWVITQFANAASLSGPYFECVAVSQTSDPTGAYYRYSFQYADFPDYPKLGIWPDAYYVTYNMFTGNTFKGAQSCAMNRARMLQGLSATQQCFSTGTSYGGVLPADLDGATAPPAGATNLHVAIGTTSTTLATWKFHVDWTTPASSTFSGPTALTVASYSRACGGGTCIPQSGTTTQLDSLADRLMYRLAYRNLGDRESLVVTHAVTASTSTGIRWYELRLASGSPSVYQQGTYAPDTAYRWMGSAAMDKSGDIGLGYSVSSSTLHPAIRYTGRLVTDALGTMPQGEGSIIEGAGSQNGGLTRWGDYASMSVDPSDDCTFWFSTEYIPANGSYNWRTRIGSFKFPSCGGTATNDFSMSASPASATVTAGSSATSTISTAVTSGSAQTVSLSASGLPTGATASFSPTSVTAGGSSTLTVATSSSTPAGTYGITVTGTGTSATHTMTFTLTVNAPTSCTARQLLGNPGFETGTAAPWTATTGVVDSSTSEPAHSGSWKAWLNGYGSTHTDTLAQGVAVPSGCTTYAFTFWLHIDTAETTTTSAFDTLKVQVLNSAGTVLSTLATYSNLNKNTGYTQRSFNLAAYAGQTVTLRFTGAEDGSLQTSFVVDDTAVNVS
ncbi:MAG TPA: hypothetical protein VFQ85_09015 [Mycobacteriales bacterium]|jgi:hypothetical protein|nr:hypothetical protein [Mycobacteriales bacterium]